MSGTRQVRVDKESYDLLESLVIDPRSGKKSRRQVVREALFEYRDRKCKIGELFGNEK